MDRRTALNRIGLLLGATVSAQTAAAVLAGCRAQPPGYQPRALAPEAYRAIETLADVILPPTDTPGAAAAGVPAFIDTMLADYYPGLARAEFIEGFDMLTAVVDEAPEGPFRSLSPEARERVLARVDGIAYGPSSGGEIARQVASTYRRFKEMVLVGYYTSEIGATLELQVTPMGEYRGDLPVSEVGRAWA